MKSVHLFGLIALAAAALHGQTYYTNPAPDCSALGETAIPVTNSSGTTIGYSCYATGTFVWYASGGGWSSQIRVAAPSTGAVNVDYLLYDQSGNPFTMDTRAGIGASTISGNEVNFSLYANQPAETDLLGATGNGPGYSTLEDGSVYVTFLCPDATTCGNVTPQLIYSDLPAIPWLLSVPIVWDGNQWTQWSAEGIQSVDGGVLNTMSFVIYNDDLTAATCNIDIYNSAGTLAVTATTPSISPLQDSGNGEGQTYAKVLSQVFPASTTFPSGTFKILFDCGSVNTEVEVLQFSGPSATNLQVSYDSSPGTTTSALPRHMSARSAARAAAVARRTADRLVQ